MTVSRFQKLAAVLAAMAWGTSVSAAPLPTLTVDGSDLVTPDGEVVMLRGCNLGNWLLLEPWMLGLDQGPGPEQIDDQHEIFELFHERFGAERAAELIERHRAGWMTPRDFEIIASFGMNAVRLPIHYSLMIDADGPLELHEDAFRWIDAGVEMAAAAGLYTVLDLHGVPGGQSVDAPSGRVEENDFWTNTDDQDRTVFLWEKLADRYGDHPAVAAYDVVNEPFGDFVENISPKMGEIFDRLHDAIRAIDADTLIYAPGTLQGIRHYGDPADHGWTNVGFTEHTYPGLFGQGEPSLATHAEFLNHWVPAKAAYLDKLDVPFFVGEYNVVFDSVGGPDLMRRFIDVFESVGWSSTMWAYKLVQREGGITQSNWSMVANERPLDLRDLKTASFETLRDRFAGYATEPLAIDEALRAALVAEEPSLALVPERKLVQIADETMPGWTATDIGDATRGGLALAEGGGWHVAGAGNDLFGRSDEFRFVHRPAVGAGDTLYTTLHALEDTHQYAKAGVMLRGSTEAGSAHALIHATPSGRIVIARRGADGASTDETVVGVSGFPVGLGVGLLEDGMHVAWTDTRGEWSRRSIDMPEVAQPLLGLAVLSHSPGVRAVAHFDAPSPEPTQVRTERAGESVLSNGSFEEAAPGASAGRSWLHWSDVISRQDGWSPVRDGSSILAYRHWEAGGDSSGVWQDVDTVPGTDFRFEVYANLDRGAAGGSPPAAVELRAEAIQPDGSVLRLATRTWQAEELATGEEWSRLELPLTAMGEATRVLIVTWPAAEGRRDGALKFDDASLTSRPRR